MANLPGTDRANLTKRAYATAEAYSTRTRIHDLYSYPKINFVEWVLDHYAWRGDEFVLDIGAGPGTYFEAVLERIPHGRLIGGDLSLGMVRTAGRKYASVSLINGDAQALPFAAETFDVVLANHMLYHIPDLNRALAEIRRVLKPAGCVIASTNSRYTLPELDQLVRRTYSLLGVRNPDADQFRPYQFYLEDGPGKLGRHFFAVARFDLPGAFVFPSVAPAVEYVNSTRSLREGRLPPGITWEEFITVLGDQMQRLINHFGELILTKLAGVLIATEAGSFAAEYTRRLKGQPESRNP